MLDKSTIAEWLQGLQDRICQALESADGTPFREDLWERPGGGGGRTRILEGRHIEKGGVNFSAVHGMLPQRIANALGLQPEEFFATGVSIVLHPRNPYVPIIHANFRFFEVGRQTWWFGGGIDLTPHYVDPAEARLFHQRLQTLCDRHDPEHYPRFKKWADDYFYLRHREETRGIGGIFFDRLGMGEPPARRNEYFAFLQDCGEAFAPLYLEILKAKKDRPYGEREQQWQSLRRGRYVEFNLVWDKGTKFGLDTQGCTESILMSLPPLARWKYDHRPQPGSPEAQTLEWLRKGVDWVGWGGGALQLTDKE